ncbi:MAG: (Na+)-NQR maturation NqrM [Planctomycetaceae bacterium]|nr:MAG: (Na+)-NQR maturation NqrM [Planctomycetaceae bacterium]
MGTVYMVKIFNPPPGLPEDWREQIDRELRQVNDQMSTYLEDSEISRFNRSESTEWFEVSAATALVVGKALEIHQASGGAFDITVAPLVNAWSFGPGKRSLAPPEPERIRELLDRVGSAQLEVREQPPAIRKARGDLTIDLSAIAKGHGVDRVVERLGTWGADNVFVEIGGDLRVRGDKGGRPWMVGIQQPDVAGDVVARAIPLRDLAIATSGDYRNFFEHEGRRYSHTIDPRTGEPIRHATASVSVIAEDCMTADGWATAINVLGPDEALEVAERNGLDALVMVRGEDGSLAAVTSGSLLVPDDNPTVEPSAVAAGLGVGAGEAAAGEAGRDAGGSTAVGRWFPVVLVTAFAFAAALGAMAIGVIFGRRSISGSCGGLANRPDGEGGSRCSLCSQPDEACSRLREAAANASSSGSEGV